MNTNNNYKQKHMWLSNNDNNYILYIYVPLCHHDGCFIHLIFPSQVYPADIWSCHWHFINGNFRIPKSGGTLVLVPYFWPYFVGDIPWNLGLEIGLIYGRYLQFKVPWNGHWLQVAFELLRTQRGAALHLPQYQVEGWKILAICATNSWIFTYIYTYRHK